MTLVPAGSDRKVRLLHITLNMEIGGTEQVIKQLVANTDSKKFDVGVLCIDGIVGKMGKELQESGVDVESLKRRPGFDLRLIRDLRTLVRDRKVDVLHCHQYTPYIYGLLASIGLGVPVLYTEHGRLYPETYKWKRMLANPILSLFTKSIVSISKATADALVRYENFPRSKIDVVYNGLRNQEISIDREEMCESLGIPLDHKVLGTISRLDPIKNQPMMIEAFAKTIEAFPNATLLIVGDGSERESLERLVDSLGIRSNVIFTGFMVKPQPFFQLLDIFLLSSLSEGTSMTLLQAMACEKPSVVTDVGGNPEIVIDGETGCLTPDQDSQSFSKAMLELLECPARCHSMGQAAKSRYLALFSETRMLQEYESRYLRLLGRVA